MLCDGLWEEENAEQAGWARELNQGANTALSIEVTI